MNKTLKICLITSFALHSLVFAADFILHNIASDLSLTLKKEDSSSKKKQKKTILHNEITPVDPNLTVLRFKVPYKKPQPHKPEEKATAEDKDGSSWDNEPSILQNPAPVYPAIARRNKWEGTVLVMVEINSNGIPKKVKLERSSGHPILDTAAIDVVPNWKFSPATLLGIPVESKVLIPIRFKLRG